MLNGRLRQLRDRWFPSERSADSGRIARARAFAEIYTGKLWGDVESVSGPGSGVERATLFRADFEQLLKELGVRTVLDAGCGDFNWLPTFELPGVEIIGVDIVPELVAANRQKHPALRFALADIVTDRLPRSDLILCRDGLVHLSNAEIVQALMNFRRSGARWLLTNTFVDRNENPDIKAGDWRPLNMSMPPFGLPAPARVIDEYCLGYGGAARDKRLALWPCDQLPSRAMNHRKFWPTLRKTFSRAHRAALNVLITNVTLGGRSGTEIVVRDLAIGLRQQGHRPIVYSPIVSGPIAAELRAASISVTDRIASIQGPVDVIHGHHTPTVATAIARFPGAPAIFVCHDFTSWHDAAPALPQVRRFVAVDGATHDRLVAEGTPPDRASTILNAIDLSRLPSRAELPGRPTRALLIAKGDGYADIVKAACGCRGIALEMIGASVGALVDDPEARMAGQHIVFASARGALEAMAVGCAVIACDARGLGGLVTTECLADWRAENFGQRILQRQITIDALLSELDRYDAADAMAVSDVVRSDAGVEPWVSRYVQVYHEAIAENGWGSGTSEAASRALADHLERWAPRLDASWPWMREREWLINEIHRVRESGTATLGAELTPLDGITRPRAIEWHDSQQYGTIAGVAGDEVLFNFIKTGHLWEPDVAGLLGTHIRPGSIAIDCGANIGVHAIAMAVRQPDVRRVIAFEPHPEIFQALTVNARSRPAIDARQIALSDKSGTKTMLPLGDSRNPGAARLHAVEAIGAKVRVSRLDDFEFENVSFIKIDVGGSEIEVIEGAERTIRTQRPALLVEIWDLDDPEARRAKIDRIARLGYRAQEVTDTHILFTAA